MQRTDEREAVDLGDLEAGEDDPRGDARGRFRLRGAGDRVRERVGRLFSPREFLLALVLATAALIAAGVALPLGPGSGLVGVFLAGFALGLVGRRRYPEVALAGALAAGTGAVLASPVLTFLGLGAPVVLLGAASGLGAGVLGHYFGRDLRAGLTREV